MLRPLLLSLAMSHRVDVASALAIEATTTHNSQVTRVKRDDHVATIDLGDVAQYGTYDGDDSVDKRAVAIFPTGLADTVPEDGYHVVFGSDVQADMENVIKGKCTDARDMSNCVAEISNLLQRGNLTTLTKRILLPVVAVYTVVEVANWIIAGIAVALAVVSGYKAAKSVNLADTSDNGVLGQIQSASDASIIALATGTDHRIMASITIAKPTPTPSSELSKGIKVEEIIQDNPTNKKGDILIHIPKEIAKKVIDFLGMVGLSDAQRECKDTSQQSRSSLDKRMPPQAPNNLRERCRRAIELLSGMVLANEGQGLELMRPADANNPMNPEQNPNGGAVPNMFVNGANSAITLARQVSEQPIPGVNDMLQAFNEWLQAAGVTLQFVYEAVLGSLTGLDQDVQEVILFLSAVEHYRVLTKDLQCKPKLICVDDDCKGIRQVNAPLLSSIEPAVFQTGICNEGKSRGCACEKVHLPYVHRIYDEYFDELEAWTQELLNPSEKPNCDSNNNLKLADNEFSDSIGKACGNHDELKRIKKRGSNGWQWSNVDEYGVQWGLDWNDKSGGCDMHCKDMFQIFEDYSTCVWDGGRAMSKAGFIQTDCGVASYSVDRPDPPECWPAPFGAPRGQKEIDEEGGVGTSVDDALVQFCNDIDGQKVEESSSASVHSRRWGFSEWRVPNRKSFWLKAEYAPRPGCQGYEWPRKTNCKAALRQGMETCGGSRTNGLRIRGIGCIDYSIHITDNTHDDSPPWTNAIIGFPPPDSAKHKNGKDGDYVCSGGYSRILKQEEIDAAIDSFCADGNAITGFGEHGVMGMIDYPPKGQPQFYDNVPSDPYNMHLALGAEIPQSKDPYQDPWCNGFDWKMGKEDCTYALRRLWGICSKSDGIRGGDILYRCVNYRSFGVNMRK